MAGRSLTSRVSLGSIPRWIAVLGIALGSRVISTAFMLWFAARQAENPWTGGHPDLFEFSRMWDSHWYRIIAETGYPSELPRDDAGRIGESAWAFMPVYPFLVRILMGITGGSFAVVSVIVSVAAFLAFLFVADQLLRPFLGDRGALGALAVIALSPVSPVYQVGYAESLGMLLLTLALVALSERRWAWAAILVPVAALTRPLGAPLALAVLVLIIVHWRSAGHHRPPLWLGAVAAASAALWPGIAWLVTGIPSAYVDTELAWRRPYTGDAPHVWGTGWWDSAHWWFPEYGPWVIGSIAAVVLLVAALPATRRLGPVPLVWVSSYLGYLVLVVFPQSSIFRLLAPMFPIAGLFSRTRWGTVLGIALGVVGQFVWLDWCWSVDGSDWTPP